jgi:hypothetical protein
MHLRLLHFVFDLFAVVADEVRMVGPIPTRLCAERLGDLRVRGPTRLLACAPSMATPRLSGACRPEADRALHAHCPAGRSGRAELTSHPPS